MKVYRDCLNGIPPFDSPAFITIFNNNGSVYTTLNVPLTSSLTVPPSNNSPCAPAAAGSACVEEAIYTFTINLPASATGYYIVYQRCCRNATILNLVNPGNTGTTYWEHIPGNSLVASNSSPRFTFRPPIYICKGSPIGFNHMASDPDGDSLVYSLCTPFNGLDQCCPIILSGTTSSCGTGACPTVNSAPPYLSVPFASPYSASYPMASNPAISINPSTGNLTGVPTILGQWVVGVCVSEYRNGILIGTHHRDFQFNVISCPFVVTAGILSETTTNSGQGTGYCNGFTISYSNNSFNGTTYHWDFGDPNTTTDTSNAYNPTYTFSTVGVYTVTLIVNPGSPCGDTATEVFHVAPLLSPDYISPTAQCFNGNTYNFNGGGSYQGNGVFSWNFGPNASPQTASTATVNNVVFNAPGTYSVVFSVIENGCTASATKTVDVYQNPLAAIGNFITSGCAPLTITFPNASSGGTSMSFLWDFGDGTTSTAGMPVKTYTVGGIYTVSLTAITSQYCIDTNQVAAVNSITVTDTPVSLFNESSATGSCFNNNLINFANNSTTNGSATYQWNFGANSSPGTSNAQNPVNVTYSSPGTYSVSLIVSEAGCADTSSAFISLYSNPVASIGNFLTAGCTPFTVTFPNLSAAGNPMIYLWTFSNGTTSTAASPAITFSTEGVYTVSLTISTIVGCIDTNSTTAVNSITVTETPGSHFTYVSTTDMCFTGNKFDFSNSSTFFGSVSHFWNFGTQATPQNSTNFNVQGVSFNIPGSYTVALTEDKNGCQNTYTSTIQLYANPVADVGLYQASGCDPVAVTFTNSSTYAFPLNYLWQFSDGKTSTDQNPMHIFTPPGVYSVSLTVISSRYCIDTNKVSAVNSITVNPTPLAGFTASPIITTIFDPDISFYNTSISENIVGWYYDFNDGANSSDVNPFHTYATWGNYYVTQTITNNFGCLNTYRLLIKILPEFRFWIPNAFTPGNKDDLNDVFKPKVIGIEEYTFMIFDRWGAQIYSTNDPEQGWNGTYKSGPCKDDVYVWKCDFKNIVSQDHEYHIGHVVLVK